MKTGRYKFNLFLSLFVAFGGLTYVLVTEQAPRLGLDLEGGISVILSATGEDLDEGVLDKTVEVIRQRVDELGVAEPEVTRGEENIFVQLPGVENEERALELIGTTAQLTFREVLETIPPPRGGKEQTVTATAEVGPELDDEEVIYPDSTDETILYRLSPAAVSGDVITNADASPDPNTGVDWFVEIEMNEEGTEDWATLTSDQACQRDEGKDDRIAIVLDGEVVAAPGMQAPDAGGSGVECGTGIDDGKSVIDTPGNPDADSPTTSEEEAKDLALVLRYGSLPITLEQQEVNQVSPTLGTDSLNAGLQAGLLGLFLVMLYMIVYYRALGFIVWLGLAIFASLIYTIMTLLSETAGLALTLAGVAGIIVSIGVTADSYIVAFERLKDEVRAGKSVRAAVERGMSRSFKTILVADFVTGSGAIILFFLAVGAVRGFALTLGLATIADVLVAYFYTRSAVHLLARTKRFSGTGFFSLRRALGEVDS